MIPYLGTVRDHACVQDEFAGDQESPLGLSPPSSPFLVLMDPYGMVEAYVPAYRSPPPARAVYTSSGLGAGEQETIPQGFNNLLGMSDNNVARYHITKPLT